MLVAVGNGPSFGGGLRITEGAVLDDGLLDVVVIKPMSKLELLRTYPKLFKGTHVHHRQYEHHRVRRVSRAPQARHRGLRRRRALRCAPARPSPPGLPLSSPRTSPRASRSRRSSEPGRSHGLRGLYDFALDDFQVRACKEIEDGRGRAGRRPRPARARRSSASSRSTWRWPPGASASTRHRSRRCRTRSSTTWSRRYGADKVGLLTGDNAINGEAPIVVMTTEVLRNMLYAGSATAARASAFVVMDEVHYLADRSRGRGVGGGHHPPAGVGGAGVAVRDRLQRRGVRRVARRPCAATTDDDRRGAPAGAAVPARDGGQADVRPVRRRRLPRTHDRSTPS